MSIIIPTFPNLTGRKELKKRRQALRQKRLEKKREIGYIY